MPDIDFATSIAIWGYYVDGDTAEPTAWMCEAGDVLPQPMERWRDQTIHEPGWIRSQGSGPYVAAPLWWKLPAVQALYVAEKMLLDSTFWELVRGDS